MLISDGERYRTRDGKRIVKVLYDPESKGDNYPFVTPCRYNRYTVDGRLLSGSETQSDLVENVNTSKEGGSDD